MKEADNTELLTSSMEKTMQQQAIKIHQEKNNIAVYNPFRAQLTELRKTNDSMVFDYESKQGQKDAKSYIYKIRQTKTAVESTRKQAKQESLEYGRKVDAEAREITEELDAMIEVHKKPLDEIQQREEARIEEIKGRIAALSLPEVHPGTSGALKALRDTIESTAIDDSFAEFKEEAELTKTDTLAKIGPMIAAAENREAEQAELERFRKEKAEREQKEREDRIREEAAQKARQQAEDESKEREEKLRREKEEAEAETARAAETERKRLEDEQRQSREEQEARARDTEHKAKIHKDIADAISECVAQAKTGENGVQVVVDAIANGKIPHVKITY